MWAASLLRLSPLPPLQTQTLTLTPTPRQVLRAPSIRRAPISMSHRPALPASDRLLAGLSYSLPFLNSLPYASFLFSRFPSLALPFDPLLPFISAYRSLPYATFLAFFALYLGVVRNPAFTRFVRFNAMQAVVLDVLLALPALLQRILGVPAKGIAFRLLEACYDAIFVLAFGCFLYGLLSCVVGRTPYLPLVASAADRQL